MAPNSVKPLYLIVLNANGYVEKSMMNRINSLNLYKISMTP